MFACPCLQFQENKRHGQQYPEEAEQQHGQSQVESKVHYCHKDKILKDPTTAMDNLSAELNVNPKTTRRIVHDNFGLKLYTKIPRYLLKESFENQKARKV